MFFWLCQPLDQVLKTQSLEDVFSGGVCNSAWEQIGNLSKGGSFLLLLLLLMLLLLLLMHSLELGFE